LTILPVMISIATAMYWSRSTCSRRVITLCVQQKLEFSLSVGDGRKKG
jgi:hypothetical protein